MRWLPISCLVLLPIVDLVWNLTHLNIGLVDFYGLAAFAHNCAANGAWPATPYFPAGYPLLLIPGGYLGSVLVWGYLLSCLGLVLALWSLYRLVRLFGGEYWLAAAAICAAWIAPVYRIEAGSPSVDPLYTGLGLWFLVAALAVWRDAVSPAAAERAASSTADQPHGLLRDTVAALPRWASMGLAVPAIILPVLRYHALVLLLPVLAVLFFWRPQYWRLVLTAAVAVVLAVGFNQVTYIREYNQPQASATELQIRTGIEISQHGMLYTSTDELFADYPAFTEQARSTSLLDDYPLNTVAKHVAANWVKFLKRGPVILALLAVLVLLGLRRPGLAGLPLAAAWIAGYTLMLSVAYYTPRAALLPVLMAIGISAAALAMIGDRRKLLTYNMVAVLLFGSYWLAYDYAVMIIRERMEFAAASAAIERRAQHTGASFRLQSAAGDWRLLPLVENPWCQPYVTLSLSWLDDPEIRKIQRRGIEYVDPRQLAIDWYSVDRVFFPIPRDPGTSQLEHQLSGHWRRVASQTAVIEYERENLVE